MNELEKEWDKGSVTQMLTHNGKLLKIWMLLLALSTVNLLREYSLRISYSENILESLKPQGIEFGLHFAGKITLVGVEGGDRRGK